MRELPKPENRRRWTIEQDVYLVRWGWVGAEHMARDLSRSVGGIRSRAKKLKDTGAWRALEGIIEQENNYRAAIGLEVSWEYEDAA